MHNWNAPASHPDGTARPPGPGQGDNEQDADSFAKFAADTDDAIAQLLQTAQGTMSAEQSAKQIKKMGMENLRLEALMMQVKQTFPDVVHDASRLSESPLQLPPGNTALSHFYSARSLLPNWASTGWKPRLQLWQKCQQRSVPTA